MQRLWLENCPYDKQVATLSVANKESDYELKKNLISQTATGWFIGDALVDGKIVSRYTLNDNIIDIITEGKFENDKLTEGKKYIGDHLILEATYDVFGKYHIINYDMNSKITKKTYFDSQNVWYKTEYFEDGFLQRDKELDSKSGLTLFNRYHKNSSEPLISGYLIENREIDIKAMQKLKHNKKIHEIKDINNLIVYVGPVKGFLPHGEGKYISNLSFTEYIGEYVEGRREGFGKTFYVGKESADTYTEKLLYEGELKNGLYHGEGTLYNQELDDGSILYSGNWENGVLVTGKQYYKDVVVYSGDFKGVAPDGHFYQHGVGCQWYSNSSLRYKGDFVLGKFNSKGSVVYNKDGSTLYTGDIVDGQVGDSGVFNLEDKSLVEFTFDDMLLGKRCYKINHKNSDGKCIFEGFATFDYPTPIYGFIDAQNYIKQNECTTYFENGETEVATYKDNLKNGKCTLYFASGNVKSECNYKEDNLNGSFIEYNEQGGVIFRGNFNSGMCVEQEGTFVLEDGSIYEGQIENSLKVGYGRLKNSDNILLYEGEFKDNKFSGNGILYYLSGKEKYTGSFLEDKFNGQGKLFREDGSLFYKGDWKFGIKDGTGSQFLEDGSIYTGSFFDDKRNGEGKLYKNKDELLYEGNFVNDEFSGKGKLYNNHSLLYDGEFLNDIYSGKGTLYYTDGTIHYEGDFKDGTFNGTGKEYNDKGVLRFDGKFANGKIADFGTIYYANGDSYCGYLKETVKDGIGEYRYSNGKVAYQGEYFNGKRHGTGTSFDRQGNLYYHGSWIEGKKEGEGRLYNINGILIYFGNWEKDCYSGKGQLCNGLGELYYEGEFLSGQRSGNGKHFTELATVDYEGEYKNDMRDGFGISYSQEDGSTVYTGFWKEGKFDGLGVLFESENEFFVGEFKEGKLNGRINKVKDNLIVAEYIFESGKMVYQKLYDTTTLTKIEGYTQNGKYNGLARQYDDCGNILNQGEFKDDLFVSATDFSPLALEQLPTSDHPQMELYNKYTFKRLQHVIDFELPDGKYYGNLKNSLPDGVGRLVFTDGRIYTGTFEQDKATGNGELKFADGKVYSGEVKEGLPCGIGEIVHPDNSIFKGTFANGKKEGNFIIINNKGIALSAVYQNDLQITVPVRYSENENNDNN